MRPRVPISIVFLVAGVCLVAAPALASADVLVLDDGSRIVGTIKSLENGKLLVATAHMGTVKVSVGAVTELETEGVFRVDLFAGDRLEGQIAIDAGHLVVTAQERRTVPLSAVAGFDQRADSAWDRTTLYVNAGLNVVRGNSTTSTYNVNAGGSYDQGRSTTSADLSATFTEQEEAADSRRSTLEVRQAFDLGHRWSAGGHLSFESNEAADLDLRTILGASAGYHLVSTPVHLLTTNLGLSWISEEYVGLDTEDELTGLVGLAYRLDGNGIFFDNRFVAYPSFEGDRYRLQFDSALRFKLLGGLDFSLNFFDRYDSRPPIDVEKNDYGLTIGLGWSH